MYEKLHLIRPTSIELPKYLLNFAYTALFRPFLSHTFAPTSVLSRHTTSSRLHSHNNPASPPLTALRSTEQPTPCQSRLSISHAGQRLMSCCSTLVSNRSYSQVLRAGAKPTATSLHSLCDARSLAASVWPVNFRCTADSGTTLLLTLFRCRCPVVTPDFAHATVAPAIHESQSRPAFA
jgi:hypothetical protein